MSSFFVLFKKEWTEAVRTSKVIWLPAVFAVLGIAQAVTAKFMPDILKSAGSLPEGTVIAIPIAKPGEVLGQTLGQFGSIGLLALCLAFMGSISGERRNGTAAWVLVKPVSPLAYAASKWTMALLLTLGSFTIGYASSWYETAALIGSPDTAAAIASGAAYFGWLALVVTAALAAGAWMNAPAAAAFVPFACATVLLLVNELASSKLDWLPSGLAAHAAESLKSASSLSAGAPAFVAFVLVVLFFGLLVCGVKSKPLRG